MQFLLYLTLWHFLFIAGRPHCPASCCRSLSCIYLVSHMFCPGEEKLCSITLYLCPLLFYHVRRKGEGVNKVKAWKKHPSIWEAKYRQQEVKKQSTGSPNDSEWTERVQQRLSFNLKLCDLKVLKTFCGHVFNKLLSGENVDATLMMMYKERGTFRSHEVEILHLNSKTRKGPGTWWC